MASIKLTGDTSGEITISAPAVAGTNTLTLPANTGTVITSATAAADVPAPTKLSTASGSAPSYSARAWVNFNGTGTVAIRESGNVSSITDTGTGHYTVNFTTAMPDANYAVHGSALLNSSSSYKRILTLEDISGTNLATGSVNVQTGHSFESALQNEDCLVVTVVIIR